MPARRFWSMEAQINRIRAEQDLRTANINAAQNPTQIETLINYLTAELGETHKVQHCAIVAPEPGAREKFLRAMG